jgi:hypothetical protein
LPLARRLLMLARMLRPLIALLTVAATVGPAAAGPKKPSTAEARKTAQAWLEAFSGDEVAALTATPFYAGSTDVGGDPACAPTTAEDAAAASAIMDCLREHSASVDGTPTLKPFGKKTWKEWDRWAYSKPYVKALRALAKNSTVLEHDSRCESGSLTIVAIAVTRDAAGALKVNGYVHLHDYCGE